MDENDQTKGDHVEMRASKKIKMQFDSMHLDTFWCSQLEMLISTIGKKCFENSCPLCNNLSL